jgi:hypothetical protein
VARLHKALINQQNKNSSLIGRASGCRICFLEVPISQAARQIRVEKKAGQSNDAREELATNPRMNIEMLVSTKQWDVWIKEQEDKYARELFKLNDIKLDLRMQTLIVSETENQIKRYKDAKENSKVLQ